MHVWDTSMELMRMPPSVNSLYANIRGRRVKSRMGKAYAQLVALTPVQGRLWASEGLFHVKVELHDQWFFKNGSVRKKDLENCLKCLLDSVCPRFGFDDSRIFRLEVEKIDSPTELVRVFARRID